MNPLKADYHEQVKINPEKFTSVGLWAVFSDSALKKLERNFAVIQFLIGTGQNSHHNHKWKYLSSGLFTFEHVISCQESRKVHN